MKLFRSRTLVLIGSCIGMCAMVITHNANAQTSAALSSTITSIVEASCATSFGGRTPTEGTPSEYETAIAEFNGGPLKGVTLYDLFRLGLVKSQTAENTENVSPALRGSSPLVAWAVHGLYFFENSEVLFVVIPNPTELVPLHGPATVHIFAKTVEGTDYSSKISTWASGTATGQDSYGNIHSFFAGRPGYWMSPRVEYQIISTPAKVLSFQIFSSPSGLGIESAAYHSFSLTIESLRVHQGNKILSLKPLTLTNVPLTYLNPQQVRVLVSPVLSAIEATRNR